jgi:hypothetical protein
MHCFSIFIYHYGIHIMFFLTGRTCQFLVLSNTTTVLVWLDDET